MPEVCEVALTAQYLNKKLKGKELKKIKFISGRYGKNRVKPSGFLEAKKMLPMKITKVDSKGKFLWFELKNGKEELYIWNTFGLTGKWSFELTEHIRAEYIFDDFSVYFSDMRNFGTFKFSFSEDELDKKLKTLGSDFLKDDDFDLNKITKFNKPIIQLLMDQKKLGSGLGNYLVAEILYRSKLSPHRTGDSLKKKEITKLTYWIKYMTKLCYQNNYIGYMTDMDPHILKMKRKNYHPDINLEDDEFEFLVYQQEEDPYGNTVKADHIIKDRTTYWVPKVQK